MSFQQGSSFEVHVCAYCGVMRNWGEGQAAMYIGYFCIRKKLTQQLAAVLSSPKSLLLRGGNYEYH